MLKKNKTNKPYLVGKKVAFRAFVKKDGSLLKEWLNNQAVNFYLEMSYRPYREKEVKDFIDKALNTGSLSSIHLAYSRELGEKKYVQHVIEENSALITRVLVKKGSMMVCGSLAMESGVKSVLNLIAKSELNLGIEELGSQIKSDCY